MNAFKACLIVAAGGVGTVGLCCLGGALLVVATTSSATQEPADPLKALRADLEWELSRIDGAELLSVDLSSRKLTVQADLGAVNSQARIESTGKILAVIGKHQPAADYIYIETPAGQTIAVSMRDLIDYRDGRLDISRFMATWRVTKE